MVREPQGTKEVCGVEVPGWLEEAGWDGGGAGVSPVGAAGAAQEADAWSLPGSAAALVEHARHFTAAVAEGLGAPLLELTDHQFADAVQLAAQARPGDPIAVDGQVRDAVGAAGAALIDAIRELENVKNAAAGAQAKAEVLFGVIEATRQAQLGIRGSALGRGTVLAVALARRESQWTAGRHVASATRIVREMPRTLEACSNGVLTERRAAIIEAGTEFLTPDQRHAVDEAIAGDAATLESMGDRELDAAVKQMAYEFDCNAFTKRLHKAESERHVSLKPEADGMAALKAFLPLKQGVAVLKALKAVADSARNAGDKRTQGQLMADVLTHRLRQHLPCQGAEGAPEKKPRAAGDSGCLTAGEAEIHLDLIMTDRALFDGADDPAILTGFSPVPAAAARAMVTNTAGQAQVWLRRLYTHPESGSLMSMDSRSRLFPEVMKRFLFDQDQFCANPWCGAPIRDYDHIKSFMAGGSTTVSNGQGLCQRCNLAKEVPGWSSEAATGADGRPVTVTRTPTGHSYSSAKPVLPGTVRRGRPPGSAASTASDPPAQGP
ncbi:HNH endonuclease signature motif containing protein [Arthrobacter sp. SDTb3-6]|uniref:HNH endonuclease n=1 Tax=Arthrobacter sp. SDTb3-6 TaxID=2713571 RepID=UPI00159E3B1D|nr:HNH endonuclease [Arthrobacter sp. SDTb3-6]